jgi:hypothetical protein
VGGPPVSAAPTKPNPIRAQSKEDQPDEPARSIPGRCARLCFRGKSTSYGYAWFGGGAAMSTTMKVLIAAGVLVLAVVVVLIFAGGGGAPEGGGGGY